MVEGFGAGNGCGIDMMHAYVRAMYDKSMDDMDAEIKSSSGH